MLHVRVVKTKGESKAVQVYRYENSKRVIVKHIGSGSTEQEISTLQEMAEVFIADRTKQTSLFQEQQPDERDVLLGQYIYMGSCYTFLYDALRAVQHQMGYTLLADVLLNDLAAMRIVEPASKLRSIALMETYFGIRHRRQRYYESAPRWLDLKQAIEKKAPEVCKGTVRF